MKKNSRPSYFRCVFYGFLSNFLGNLYYLILVADEFSRETFSLGIFGDIGLFLFIIAANLTYIPKELEEKKFEISIPGIIISGVYLVSWVIPVLIDNSVGNIVVCIFYALTSVVCLYTCISILENKHHNEMKKSIRPFIICIVVMIATYLAYQILVSIGTKTCLYIAGIGIDAIGIIATLASMYLLKKGLEPWEI